VQFSQPTLPLSPWLQGTQSIPVGLYCEIGHLFVILTQEKVGEEVEEAAGLGQSINKFLPVLHFVQNPTKDII
jgi:hypothetical protein